MNLHQDQKNQDFQLLFND